MSTPAFVADFDSATGLVRALAAALARRPYRRLGRSHAMGAAVRASRGLPESLRNALFSLAGAREGIPPERLAQVDPEQFTRWVVEQYGPRQRSAVAIGSSNGSVIHLCAAMGVPWLPQTFLVPVRRRGDPDDCVSDAYLATGPCQELLGNQPGLSIHQMHDPNQDRLMIRRIAYFRMKMTALTRGYKRYLRRVLEPGGTILVVDTTARWPVMRRGPRHVFQQGAVGGLQPGEYGDGSPRVRQFLADQHAAVTGWRFPQVDDWVPEAEWGYLTALDEDIRAFARQHGYRVATLRIDSPEAVGAVVANVYRDWYAALGDRSTRLLTETFICVEPGWALGTRTVPLWQTFGTEPALEAFSAYVDANPGFHEVAITLFPHGVRSAGYADAARWTRVATDRGMRTTLAGVDAARWPADFASLATYANALHRLAPPADPPPPLSLDDASAEVSRHGAGRGVSWVTE